MSFLAQREHPLVYDRPPLLPLDRDLLLLALLPHALPRRHRLVPVSVSVSVSVPLVLPLVAAVADDAQRPHARGKVRRDVRVKGAAGERDERERRGVQLEELAGVDAVPLEVEAVLEDLRCGEREEHVCVRVVLLLAIQG